jgi:inorganic pyrophosphatase
MTEKEEKEFETIPVIVEIPKGSRNKYEYDEKSKRIKLDRMLFSAMHYPSDYGFIDQTLALDKDPLDAMVMGQEPTFPGCLIEARPIGLFKMHDEKGIDDKILCVPIGDPYWGAVRRLEDLPAHLLKEIEHFFTVYKELEKKKTGIEGWRGFEEAVKVIREARQRFKDTQKNAG